MKLSLCLHLYFLTLVHSIPNRTCNRIKVGEHWYDREVLWANVGRPYNLNVHKTTNTLFFTYAMTESYSDDDFQMAYLQLDNTEYNTIAGLKGGCAIAVDQENDEVYLGGNDGIHKYNMMTKIADEYKEKGKNIWALFFKRNLFYVSYPDLRLYIEIDGTFSKVKEFEDFEVDNFFVTSYNEIYFANRSGLFMYDNDKMKSKLLNEFLSIRQMSIDNEDVMYLSTNAGLYINNPQTGLSKIIPLRNIYGITFDKDNNLIYSDDNSIVMLKYSKRGCNDDLPHWR